MAIQKVNFPISIRRGDTSLHTFVLDHVDENGTILGPVDLTGWVFLAQARTERASGGLIYQFPVEVVPLSGLIRFYVDQTTSESFNDPLVAEWEMQATIPNPKAGAPEHTEVATFAGGSFSTVNDLVDPNVIEPFLLLPGQVGDPPPDDNIYGVGDNTVIGGTILGREPITDPVILAQIEEASIQITYQDRNEGFDVGNSLAGYLEGLNIFTVFTFDELTDTPSTKVGSSKNFVTVSQDETALEYSAPTMVEGNGISITNPLMIDNPTIDIELQPNSGLVADNTGLSVDGTIVRDSRQIIAGDGMTQTASTLATDITLNVAATAQGGLKANADDIEVDIVGTNETTSLAGTDVLLVETASGKRRITRDNLLAGLGKGAEIRGTVNPTAVGGTPPDPLTPITTLTVTGDPDNATISQGVEPTGAYPSGFTYIILLDPVDRQTGVNITMAGPSGSPQVVLVFDGDQLVWTGSGASGQFTHLETGDNVISVHGRQGVVVADNGDYTASQITNVPSGNLIATDVQGALDEHQVDIDNLGTTISTVDSNAVHITGDEDIGGKKRFTNTDAVKVPSGVTAQRGAGEDGDFRVNTETDKVEYYSGGLWRSVETLEKWQDYARTEADMVKDRQIADQYAASGFVHYGANVSGVDFVNVNEGLHASGNLLITNLRMGRDSGNSVSGESKTQWPVSNIAGFTSEIRNVNKVSGFAINEIKFPEAPDGTVTFNSATGEIIQHPDSATAFAAETTDVKVVIDRHDMFGGEFFLEEVSVTNPYVYPRGMIQSQAATFEGVTTVRSNRPDSYYAVFDGDIASAGLGVDFFALTDTEKQTIVSNPVHNIYILDDGTLVQWRMRQRTVAGAGNGDWENVNPSVGNLSQVITQGINDVLSSGGYIQGSNLGIFISDEASDAVDGECYFHVWGVVRRLNQGAYHPSFNPLGANLWESISDPTGSHHVWYNGDAYAGASTLDAFVHKSQISGAGAIGGASGRNDGRFYDAIYEGGDGGVNDHRLSAWDMSSKEEASKVFQKVVNGTFRGEEGLLWTQFFNNAYTGYFSAENTTHALFKTAPSGGGSNIDFHGNGLVAGRPIIAWQPSSGLVGYGAISNTNSYLYLRQGYTNRGSTVHQTGWLNQGGSVNPWYFALVDDVDSSVSGEFQMVDVIGDPAEILATPDLANGWQGGWIPRIPDGTSFPYPVTRKNIVSGNINRVFTSNNGGSWTYSSVPFNNTTNTVTTGPQSTDVHVYWYTAFAKQTVEADNEPVLNGREGLGNIYSVSDYRPFRGSIFSESLTGKINTSSSTGNTHPTYLDLELLSSGFVYSEAVLSVNTLYPTKHQPVSLGAPDNSSPACKALWYQTANNQQVSLNFAWNELIHGAPTIINVTNQSSVSLTQYTLYKFTGAGTLQGHVLQRIGSTNTLDLTNYVVTNGSVFDSSNNNADVAYAVWKGNYWGDDSTINITDGTSTYTNLNGDICLRGTATLSKPIGYSRNQARAGTQTGGIDL